MNNINKNNLVIVDCGRNTSTFYDGREVVEISHDNLFNKILSCPEGTYVIAEEAHLGVPRKRLSVSQAWYANQLKDLYSQCEERGIFLRFFPQDSTPRALDYYRSKYSLSEDEFKKTDFNDPKAIWELIIDFPTISLGKPKSDFINHLRDEGIAYKNEVTKHLNYARADNQAYFDPQDKTQEFLRSNLNFILNNISEDAIECLFGGELDDLKHKVGDQAGEISTKKVKLKYAYTILATLMNYDGSIRKRESTGEISGWEFIKQEVFNMRANHRKGGTARSNLYHWGMKTYFARQMKLADKEFPKKIKDSGKEGKIQRRGYFTKDVDRFFLEHRKRYCKAIKELWTLYKNMLTK